ncbi:MAG: hypothetical protein JW750_05080 [Anaerolineaceae bacterium]|nr:hypothetical protein [Anaerolineaceae bacterium]
MRTIRASEIGSYLFCARAWWYRRQGVESKNQHEMSAGTAYHQQHGGRVLRARLTRLLGMILLLAAILLIAIGITLQLLG